MLPLFIFLASVDLLGRVCTLFVMMQGAQVRCFTYRTWVLLVAFLNFAWIFYYIFAFQRKERF